MTICTVCGRDMPAESINTEGVIHHGKRAECKDRKSCEKAKRKAARRAP